VKISVESSLVSPSRVVVEARGQFGNTGKEDRLPLEAVTRRMMKTVTDGNRVRFKVSDKSDINPNLAILLS
jgi:hypothetical protein